MSGRNYVSDFTFLLLRKAIHFSSELQLHTKNRPIEDFPEVLKYSHIDELCHWSVHKEILELPIEFAS